MMATSTMASIVIIWLMLLATVLIARADQASFTVANNGTATTIDLNGTATTFTGAFNQTFTLGKPCPVVDLNNSFLDLKQNITSQIDRESFFRQKDYSDILNISRSNEQKTERLGFDLREYIATQLVPTRIQFSELESNFTDCQNKLTIERARSNATGQGLQGKDELITQLKQQNKNLNVASWTIVGLLLITLVTIIIGRYGSWFAWRKGE